ncbi:flavodoxin-dependent (E)-4-hydroxy-3-methylbut-2-enyl-diphosphate synthase [Candidatus Woesearchaeota archaeon]|nr:flavodoxin-dependent (E)-4-hydroxy-3-methylbut-2-enyl-diphosphate synthase [Candidatus Woesearchaeota archaeon]
MRKKTREVKVGSVKIGGSNPISIQSMANTLTKDIDKTLDQIHSLEESGCEIIRVSVPDMESAKALKEIRSNMSVPLAADIHFDYRLAVESAGSCDKLRINPGNIGDDEKVKKVIDAAKDNSIPIRVGVNLGSLEKSIEKSYGLTAKALVESALKNVRQLEKEDFHDIIISLKASDAVKTIDAYTMISCLTDYPLHVGVTEAGSLFTGTIRSSVGIGSLLSRGIGDTIRVSLSADPVEEVRVAKQILQSLNLRRFGVSVTSCPTCARANIDVSSIASEIEEKAKNCKKPLNIAVMGCAVNGPGEAKEADIGVVGGKGCCLFYKGGEIIERIKPEEAVDKVIEGISLSDKQDQPIG